MTKLMVGLLLVWGLWCPEAHCQRVYAPHSVLAAGNWYKIGVTGAGVYKIDLSFLTKLGVHNQSIPSSSIRLFGNGGAMLPEPTATPRQDDLAEVPIQVVDGGDGVFNGSDYILFYAPGPNTWTSDSLNKGFHHTKNLYSDTTYYFLSIQGTGLRISNQAPGPTPNESVTTYLDREYHELDSLNFLESGKSWYGELMADIPGASTTLDFMPSIPGLLIGQPVTFTTDFLSRSIGTPGTVTASFNDSVVGTLSIQATGNGAYDLFGYELADSATWPLSSDTLHLHFSFASPALDAEAWLGWWELMLPRSLNFQGSGQFTFRDWNSVGPRATASFQVGGAAQGAKVWEVTNPAAPVQMAATVVGTQLQFSNDASRLREYVAFEANGALIPAALGTVPNQDLHGSPEAALIIVTYPAFLVQAERLAAFHRTHDSLNAVVATTTQVYNEFASGSPDPTAIRDFVKMFYDRAGTDTALRPRYLLLFGDGSYDYKHRLAGNDNWVPVFESANSLDPLGTYTSDDYFGMLKDGDDIDDPNQTPLLDLGVGRIPARAGADAQNVVAKILSYNTSATQGPWRTELTFVADDGDQNLHLQDAEAISSIAASADPILHLGKIYLDAYPEQVTTAGGRYPEVVQAINQEMYTGTMGLNYNGHGGDTRLSNEDILDAGTVAAWQNATHLPLLITATCDFAPYDDPLILSLGEQVVLQPKTGAIGLLTTTRDVYAFSNLIINTSYMQAALQAGPNGQYPSLGTSIRNAKNATYLISGDAVNNRKFTLLGDPALTLAFPREHAATLTINGRAVRQDTLKALNKCTVVGSITNQAGQPQNGFNGTAYVTVYDKPQPVQTRGNNPGSLVTTFYEQNSVLFQGKASVTGGKFQYTFVVPKDIDYTLGTGKILYYAGDGATDASGADSVLVGGSGGGIPGSSTGPTIKAYLNDEQFVNGGITNQNPVLLINLFDSSGINTTGTGVGHGITAVLDENASNPYVLSQFYQAAPNSYQTGTITYPLQSLSPGPHTLLIRAWDVEDNSSQFILNFIVENSGKLVLSHVLNYPNPFTTRTTFWFEHDEPGVPLQVLIRILTVTGRIIKTVRGTIIDPGDRSSELEWDGRDDYGNKVGRGVYIFELQVRMNNGQTATAINKMVLL